MKMHKYDKKDKLTLIVNEIKRVANELGTRFFSDGVSKAGIGVVHSLVF